LTLLDEYTTDLRQLQGIDFKTYVENKLVRRTVERTLHLAVEACLDISQHIVAQEGFRHPADNQDVFAVLAEEGIVSGELLPSLIAMAKFRNLIVHDYARIDNAIVFSILKRRLDDFDAYARTIVNYLKSIPQSQPRIE
jgi:uncharacterized protein YutE (UPF0331/DUF86 family)